MHTDSVYDDLIRSNFRIVAEHESTTMQINFPLIPMFVVCSTANGDIPHETDWTMTVYDCRDSYENGVPAGVIAEYDSTRDTWSLEQLHFRIGKHLLDRP